MQTPLSDPQRRHLYEGLAHLERQLSGIEAILEAAAKPGLFPRYVNDVPAAERQRLEAAIAGVREQIRSLLADAGMSPAPASIGALQAVRSHLQLAEVGAEETGARAMRGYGPLSVEQAEALDQLAETLRTAVAALMPGAKLTTTPVAAAAPGSDLAEALEAETGAALEEMAAALTAALEMGAGKDELPLAAGDALAQVARRIAAAALQLPPDALPEFDIDAIRWRLDPPRLAALGHDFLLGRFRRQLAPRREEVQAALRAYGLKAAAARRYSPR